MTSLVRRGSLLLALTAVTASASFAQERQVLRAERTLFFAPHIGFAAYLGDHDVNPFDGGYFQGTSGEELPVRYGGQIGYQFSPYVAASVGGAIGNYTTIWREENGGVFNNFNRRYMADALVRLTSGAMHARFAPYVEVGARLSNGETNPPGGNTIRLSGGPLLGVGVDMAVTRHTSLLLGGNMGFMFPDANTDANDFTGVDRFGPFDLLGGFGVSVKYNFKGAVTRPYIVALSGPDRLEVGQTGMFTATTNRRIATGEMRDAWSFGDGVMAEGTDVSHAYSRAGTYTVSFSTTTPYGMAERTLNVEVVPPPIPPAAIVAIDASPREVRVAQPVRFTVRATGGEPFTYAWAFGDGATSTVASPSHAYDRAGTYTATLTLGNAAGQTSRSVQVLVTAAPVVTPPAAPTCAIAELSSVFFARNSSTVDARAQADLRANMEALSSPECATTTVRVEGYAAPGERASLADERAQAVAAAYMAMGMTRVTAMGMGSVGAQTSKKEDTSQFRRVDSIPQRAETRSGMNDAPAPAAPASMPASTGSKGAGAASPADAAPTARASRTFAPIPGAGYVVVVGGAPTESEAVAMAEGMGGDVRVIAGETADGVPVYRVAVGHHARLSAARTALAQIRASGPSDAWLLRVR